MKSGIFLRLYAASVVRVQTWHGVVSGVKLKVSALRRAAGSGPKPSPTKKKNHPMRAAVDTDVTSSCASVPSHNINTGAWRARCV